MVNKKLGPTGKHPGGRLNEDDEGEIVLAVGVDRGKVVVNFATPVAWIAMNPQEASDFASVILKAARQAAKDSNVILTVNL